MSEADSDRAPGIVPGRPMSDRGESGAAADDSEAFTAWFRDNFVKLTADLMRIGAGYEEGQDAAASAAEDLYHRWKTVRHPYAYARTTALRSVLKTRERGRRQLDLMLRAGVGTAACKDPGLTTWEDTEWVTSLLRSLPPAQREVIACIVDQFTPLETAHLLGRTPEAVRRALADARIRLRADLIVMRAEGYAPAARKAIR